MAKHCFFIFFNLSKDVILGLIKTKREWRTTLWEYIRYHFDMIM